MKNAIQVKIIKAQEDNREDKIKLLEKQITNIIDCGKTAKSEIHNKKNIGCKIYFKDSEL